VAADGRERERLLVAVGVHRRAVLLVKRKPDGTSWTLVPAIPPNGNYRALEESSP
jgi:hypothetical protein